MTFEEHRRVNTVTPFEEHIRSEITRVEELIKSNQKLLADLRVREEELRAERLALGTCEKCKRKAATGHYGKLLTCDGCNDSLNDEFDREYA